jgi:hypothetical protein
MILFSKGTEIDINEQIILSLRAKWPTKPVENELHLMYLFLVRRPASRPVNIWRFIDNWLKKSPDIVRPLPNVGFWWTTDERTLNYGRGIGLEPRPGETMSAFRDRINAKQGTGNAQVVRLKG